MIYARRGAPTRGGHMDAEKRIREIAHRLWEESGRQEGVAGQHWAQAHQIFDAENSKLVEQASAIALNSEGQRPRESHMRGIDEILADAQKILAQSLQEAFDAGKAHTASELKRRMTAIFDDLISGDAETHHAQSHAGAGNGHQSDQSHNHTN
jgi:hypothetical protein